MNWTVVIPLKDEVDSIGLQIVWLKQFGIREVVVAVDGKSTEAAIDEAIAAGARVIEVPPGNKGLARIYRYALGVCAAEQRSDVIVEMDAGGSHSALDIMKFVNAFYDIPNLDVVFARRFGKLAKYNAKISRKLLSFGGTILTNLLDYPFSHRKWWEDATSGYIAYRTLALQQILNCPQISTGYYYQTEVRRNVRKLNLNTFEVPITFNGSSSSLKFKDIFEALKLAVNS
jgi:dolichol-phosphate mannosyltransferase